jgi:hypothetical protein
VNRVSIHKASEVEPFSCVILSPYPHPFSEAYEHSFRHAPVILFTAVTASLPAQVDGVHPKPHGKLRVLIVDGFSNHAWRQNTLLLRGILASAGGFTAV